MNRMCATNGISTSLWQPNIFHFPFFDQLFEFPHLHPLMMSGRTDERQTTKYGSQSTDSHSFLYRHWLINAMLVVEINVINSKALKTCFTTCSNIIWSALHTHATDIESSNAKFGGNLYLLTGKMLKCLLKKNTLKWNWWNYIICVPKCVLCIQFRRNRTTDIWVSVLHAIWNRDISVPRVREAQGCKLQPWDTSSLALERVLI